MSSTYSCSWLKWCSNCYFVFTGLHFDLALFVPNQSQYNKLGSNTSAPAEPEEIDLSWQLSLQTVWEKLLHGDKGYYEAFRFSHLCCYNSSMVFSCWSKICLGWRSYVLNGSGLNSTDSNETSLVFESLPLAIEWLRKNAREDPSTSYQVKAFLRLYPLFLYRAC
jgi:folylpolyglutamate synthase